MKGIKEMVENTVDNYSAVGEQADREGRKKKSLGNCPNCGAAVYSGKYGAYCSDKCGMQLGKAFGKTLTEDQVKSLLEGNRIFMKGLTSKAGKKYDAYLTPGDVKPYSYEDKAGVIHEGLQYSFEMSFPERKRENKEKRGYDR